MELAVISGKGGTGKSSISAAFATLHENIVLADCDVDAANLYLLFQPQHDQVEEFLSGRKAVIDYDRCADCGLCIDYCRFDAIHKEDSRVIIDAVSCDGCELCMRICPEEAIYMVPENGSKLYSGSFRKGQMVYGRLAPGEENSGRLVDVVRKRAREIAQEEKIENIVLDGPPGIGCPVLSTITGVDHVVIVTEPTRSGLHDLKRTVEVTRSYDIPTSILINKYDLNETMANQIRAFCSFEGLMVVAMLPFDRQVVDAMVNGMSIAEYAPDSEITALLRGACQAITKGRAVGCI
jgi:MinD superfamily P-loop ATPase